LETFDGRYTVKCHLDRPKGPAVDGIWGTVVSDDRFPNPLVANAIASLEAAEGIPLCEDHGRNKGRQKQISHC
jgi:hypothetical protein